MDFQDIFKGAVDPKYLKVQSNYASNTKDMVQGDQEVDLLSLTLDPSVAPVWTIVVLARPRVGLALLSYVQPSYALGRLYISGGGGGGVAATAVPFDPKSIVFLTVPASTIRVTMDCSIFRVPGVAERGDGLYSAYAVPFAHPHADGAFYTEYTATIPAASSGTAGIANIPAALISGIAVYPTLDPVIVSANLGAYSVGIGESTFSQIVWQYPSAINSTIPGWLPVPTSSGIRVVITNNSLLPARYAVINKLRV